MGFHGYGGHTSYIIGECSIADCPEGLEIHYHSPGSSSCNHGHYRLHPDRTVVPLHRNDGPIDLSQYCTPTGRGTWSIGGGRSSRQSSNHLQIQATSSHQVTSNQYQLASTLCPNKQISSADDATPLEAARLYQSTPNVDIPKFTANSNNAKNDRSTGDTENVELENTAAEFLDLVRAMAFPIPVCHEHSHICANTAKIRGVGKALAVSPSIKSTQRLNSDSTGWYGVYGDTVHPIGKRRPEINKKSSLRSGSTASSGEGSE